MGKQFLNSVRKQMDVIDDPFVSNYINDLGQYLVKAVKTKDFNYRFFVINQDVINAFAGPGGVIFVYTGLIDRMDKVDELAAVLCHEIGHVANRHISKRIAQYSRVSIASLVGILAGALIGGAGGDALMTGTMAAGQQKELSYSRNDERQADQSGFGFLARSGFNPIAMKKALLNLQEDSWVSNQVPPYLLTHPVTPERIADIDSLLASHNYVVAKRKEPGQFRKTYPLFKTIIRAEYQTNRDMVGYYTSKLSKSPDSPLAHLGLAIALTKKYEYSRAIEHFKKAIAGLSDPLPAIRYLSETYMLNGQAQKAIHVLKKTLTTHVNDKPILSTLAQAYQNAGKYKKAIRIYEKLKYMEPADNKIFYNLGFSYGKEGKLGLAHYNFGLFQKREDNFREAMFHFQRAKRAAANNPELLKKIEAEIREIKRGGKYKMSGRKPGFGMNYINGLAR